ncbi:hypothetical protein CN448_32485 [Bacillus cereus]|nr:hypothetical protein CN448_32485 [Bacillus cereus]
MLNESYPGKFKPSELNKVPNGYWDLCSNGTETAIAFKTPDMPYWYMRNSGLRPHLYQILYQSKTLFLSVYQGGSGAKNLSNLDILILSIYKRT